MTGDKWTKITSTGLFPNFHNKARVLLNKANENPLNLLIFLKIPLFPEECSTFKYT